MRKLEERIGLAAPGGITQSQARRLNRRVRKGNGVDAARVEPSWAWIDHVRRRAYGRRVALLNFVSAVVLSVTFLILGLARDGAWWIGMTTGAGLLIGTPLQLNRTRRDADDLAAALPPRPVSD